MLVEGRVGSNMPAFCEFLRAWETTLDEKVDDAAGDVADDEGGSVKGEGPFRDIVSAVAGE